MALSDYDFYVVGVRSDKRLQRRGDEQRQCPFELESVVFSTAIEGAACMT